ncbi:hypothetical protein V2S84_21260 [Azotobacter chroococcum]|nr:hypothetical protein [Azotobacter chroococcum]
MLAAAVLGFGLAAHQAVAGNQSSSGFEMPSEGMFAESLPHGPGRSPDRAPRRAGREEEAGEPASPLFQAIYSVGGWSQDRRPPDGEHADTERSRVAARRAFFF